MKSRMWESCSYGSVRVRAANCPFYSTMKTKVIRNSLPFPPKHLLSFAHVYPYTTLVERNKYSAAITCCIDCAVKSGFYCLSQGVLTVASLKAAQRRKHVNRYNTLKNEVTTYLAGRAPASPKPHTNHMPCTTVLP